MEILKGSFMISQVIFNIVIILLIFLMQKRHLELLKDMRRHRGNIELTNMKLNLLEEDVKFLHEKIYVGGQNDARVGGQNETSGH